MKLVEDVASRAKRIAGTVNDSVEKFLYRAEGEARVWVLAVAKLDIAPVNFFTELWLLDTYAKKAENKKLAVHKVIKDLDGTRGVQYTRSVSLPGGFKDRLFESWITFEERVEADGRRTYIIAWCPLEKYKGTHHRVDGAEMLQKATTRGVYIVRELTDNTCEWTWAQQVDMKIALPARALVMYATKSLARANKLQDMFRRNGKAVDRERVEALATIMQGRRGMPPMADQAGVFERCLELLREGGEPSEKGWKNLESPSQEVEMKMKYFPSKYGERSVGTGKAVGVVDCSAEEFAAWVMDFLSNTRVRISKEFNNPARIEMRKLRRENEGSFATVKKLPSFLDNREFVFRQIWRAEEGKATVVFESIDDKVDYGVTFRKKTQGHIKGFYAIEDLPLRGGAKQCRVTLVQKIDVGGSIPTWVADKKMTTYLGVVHEAFDYFRQDNRIDAADRGELSALIVERGNEQVYSEEENAMLQRVSQKFDGSLEEGKWTKLKSPDVFVRMESVFEKGSSAGVGRAVTVVDASLEDCAAWELMKMSREAMKDHHEWGGLDRKVVELTEHSSLYYVAYDLGVASLAAREWLCARVWKKVDENSMICCYEDAEDENFPPGAGKKYARASSNAFWKYERLHEVKGIPQTRVTYSLQADLKGLIPVFIANFKITSTLAALSTMRKKFEKSVEVDASNRAVIAQKIKEKGESGGAEALAKFEALYRERTGWQRPSRSFGKVDCKLLSELVSAKTWGSNSLQIRGGLHDIAAFIWDFGSRANMEISRDVERSFEKEVAWGLMFRVIVGAVLSVTDLASDLFVLKQFWNGGKEMLVFRNATFASLTMSMAFYLLYKLARRDFTYWLPVYGVTGVLLSGIIRIIIKLIVDFAAIVHFRHPYELGGLFWSINMFLPLLGLVAVIASDLPKGIFSEATLELFTSYIMVLGFSLLSFLSLFLLLMNKEYRHTFFSMETGAHLTRSAFTDGEDDFEKSYLIGCNEDQWKLFIGDEVEAWVKENWTTWEGEKPDWFTDQWISNVPREMIPKKMIDKEKSSTAKVTESRRTNRISKISKVAPEGLEEREEHLDEELLVMENQQTASFDV
ncbi:hypothetical protein TrST_g565 [Triparma strigata]|uniref:START domain-containing protein n=1 Tax=Triparma strigata TaxID=1606541 RepID=A0A9W7BSS6_9STRA|nr:hypothetical protein TrST_g565 [Triparma strigata]